MLGQFSDHIGLSIVAHNFTDGVAVEEDVGAADFTPTNCLRLLRPLGLEESRH